MSSATLFPAQATAGAGGAWAPTTLTVTSPTGSVSPAPTPLRSKVKLTDSLQETKKMDRLADLFALLTSLEHIETAYVRDAVQASEYQEKCFKLLGQYRTWIASNSSDIGSLEEFCKRYRVASPAALARIAAGMPATVQHGASASASGKDGGKKDRAVLTLTATERFITAMDSLKLQMKAVDELYPLVNEILDSISKFDALPPDHDSRTRVSKWVTSLHSMKASDELSEEQMRQMYFDIDSAYVSFRKFLESHK